MRTGKQSHGVAFSCFTLLLVLIAAKVGAEEQPGSLGTYAPPSEDVVRKLLNVARKACTGLFSDGSSSPWPKTLNLSGAYYFYDEQPAAEISVILARDCPEPRPNAEFIIGRVVHYTKGPSFFYKTSALTARPIAAAQSFFDRARNDIIFEPIAVTSEHQDSYKALIGFLMTKWGR
jgi:hypothetical protein